MELKKRRFLHALEQCGLNNEAALSHASKPCNNGASKTSVRNLLQSGEKE
jgi:hypothetical protein